MQKSTQITRLPFLVVQATYENVLLGLYGDLNTLIQQEVSKFQAGKDLIPALNQLLSQSHLTYRDLQFIGINQGPAPFTSLRAIIATVNGIAFATKIPLVVIDGLQTLYSTVAATAEIPVVILLNAFNNEVYYAYHHQAAIQTGVGPIHDILNTINTIHPTDTVLFAGGGSALFHELIVATYGQRALFGTQHYNTLSLETLAQECLYKFDAGMVSTQATPLYLKPAVRTFIQKVSV
jgi:tRNA threonylcarbamoyladenosine biosynthesis protein TsaB